MSLLHDSSPRVWRLLTVAALVVVACRYEPPAPRVRLEPAVDLRPFRRVAVVDFAPSGPGAGPAARLVTRRFVESVQGAQPGVRLLELGAQDRVLAAIGRRELDLEAIQAIGRKYGADAVFTGQLELSEAKPGVRISHVLERAAKADVEARLDARLIEADGGATLWSRSSQASEQVAATSRSPQGRSGASARDPEAAYGRLAHALAQRVSRDLAPHYAD